VRYNYIILSLIFLSLFLCTSLDQILAEWKIPTPISSNNFLGYENSKIGYKLKYPDNWNISESKYNTIFYPITEEQKIKEQQQPSIYLTIANTSLLDVPISLESIVEETINNLNSTLTDLKLIESTSMFLNNDNIAHKLVYSFNEFNKSITNMDIGLIANNDLFLLSFSAFSNNYNKYLPTVEKMIEYFEILPNYTYTDTQSNNMSSNLSSSEIESESQTTGVKKQIEICCTWGNQLADGILTYEINNAKPETKKLVIAALNSWEQNIKGIEFEEAVRSKEHADLKIIFINDNGKIPGQTITNFDSNGFIFNVKISLAEKAFGKQLKKNVIEYIAKHQIGNALGLGSANFKESIMSSLIYHPFNQISYCERGAIAEANKWKLIDNSSLPKISNIKQYYC
jgi:hypothetical protein